MNKLEEARKSINEIDKEMAALFVKRMQAAKLISEYKMERGLPILDQSRENELIAKNSAFVEDETLRSYYVNFIKDTMSISRKYQQMLQEGLTVAYSGVEGAFANIAAKNIFPSAKQVPFGDFTSAYESVVNGECDCAVLPIENSYAGEVSQVIDLMFQGGLYINGIYDLEVTHNLLGLPGASIDDIKTVISHPQALEQCSKYIKKHGFEAVRANNTAIAAQQVVERGDKSVAAIASRDTAKLYGLKVMERRINESSQNTTRFAVFSRAESLPDYKEQGRQFIMVFTVRDEAGALAQAINIIGSCGFNMRTLRSRPMKELMWKYYFYVEADGNAYSQEGKRMMSELSQYCDHLRIIGSFPHEKKL
ncbi:MAG: chorismate mutase [Oscillospiraceae bacterium]|nr:chorismate mutase [Oscillospiraceae bacterium]